MKTTYRAVAAAALVLAMAALGTGPALAACPNANPNPNVNLRLARDFNGDCKSEIVWRNSDGSNALWYMNGASRSGSALLLEAEPPWFIAGAADFNGDGKSDLLWRGPDGSVAVWLMNDATKTASAYVMNGVPFSWDIAGIGDFDGDGKSDILWRAADGSVAIWFMNGMAVSNSAVVASVPADWFIAGVGDFDGDGKSDILWRARDSSVAIWRMSGAVATPALLTSVPVSWSVPLVGDFNGDGKADIFWRNTDGTNAIWLMNGTTIATGAIVNVTPTSWELSGGGDFNGDGKTDIVWRNLSDGSVAVWLMNGIAVASSAIVMAVPDFGWAMLPSAPSAAGSIPACSAVTPTDAITPSAVASRVSGVAPLAVFFDALATTATTTSRAFHELEYRWDFGDAGSGSWTSTPDMPNLSRNQARGPVASHVFESPGTYNVCLAVFDGANTAIARTQITVQDPEVVFAGSKTTCFSDTADFTGCPAGAQRVTTSNFTSAINTYIATGRRLLFKRGAAFTVASTALFRVTGPGIIGAFGSGARPIVNITFTNATAFLLSSGATPAIKDWRFMDLDVRGNNQRDLKAFAADGGFDQLTFLRLNIQDLQTAFEFSSFVLNGYNGGGVSPHHVWDQLAVVDSTMSNMLATGAFSGGYGGYVSGTRLAWLGTVISNMVNGEHGLRLPYAAKAVVSHNRISDAAPQKQAFTLRGPCQGGTGCLIKPVEGFSTELVVISDNKFVGGTFAWTVLIGPENDTADERIRHTLWERNWFTAGPATQAALVIAAPETTVRNNLCDMSGGFVSAGEACFAVVARGIAPPADNVRIHNNTAYTADATLQFNVVSLESVATNASVINNIGSARTASPRIVGAPAGLVMSNNVLNSAPATLFVSATPAAPADFRLKAAPNPARDTGLTTLRVFSDFFRLSRPQNVMDMGAMEGP